MQLLQQTWKRSGLFLIFLTGFSWYVKEVTAIHNEAQNNTVGLVPCKEGWYFFKDKCYKGFGHMRGSQHYWDNALAECKKEGGTLATVYSKEVKEFLVAFVLLEIKYSAWIGLEDKGNEGDYVWADGSSSSYRNWEPGEPSGKNSEHEDCVEMVHLSGRPDGKTGQWNDNSCSTDRPYLCQTEKGLKKSRDPRFCYGNKKGWKYLSSCYYVVEEKKSWEEAEKYCQNNFDGHLAMFKDFTNNVYLDYILSNFNEDAWIGIKIKDKRVRKWSSGWHVAYTNWADHQPDFQDGNCVKRYKSGKWTSSPCTNKYSFICEKSSKGPPVLPPAPKGAKCPDEPNDWIDLDGEYCYFFDLTNYYHWYRANFECQKRGGQLLKLHSQEESDMLQPFLIYKIWGVWIGFYKNPYGDGFVWSEDRSRMNWTRWDSGEPNRDEEKCGEVWLHWMRWHNAMCEWERGYVCSTKKVLVSQSLKETNTANHPDATRDHSDLSPQYVTCASGSSCVPIIRCVNIRKLPNWLTAGQTCGPGPYALRQVCCSGPTLKPARRPRCGQSYVEHDNQDVSSGVEIKESVEGQWPWMVAILGKRPFKSESELICSGFLIGGRYAITAASCFDEDNKGKDIEYTVHGGNIYYNLGEVYQIINITIPSTYVRQKIPDNIAILTLNKALSPSLSICLPDRTILSMDLAGFHVTVAGWGEKDIDEVPSPVLKHLTNFPLWSNKDCNSLFRQKETGITNLELPRGIDNGLICAGFREKETDVCKGFSGAPLMIKNDDRWFAVGVVGFGVGCGATGMPSVNLRISEYMEWIKENIKD